MITCEQIRPLLTAWLDHELSAEDTAEVERHIADCLLCARLAEQYRDLLASALYNQTEKIYTQTSAADNAPDVWNDVEKRIQEERQAAETTQQISSLRLELEQMQDIVRALQAEVVQLRRQVSVQKRAATSLSGALMPGPQPTPDTTRLQFLL